MNDLPEDLKALTAGAPTVANWQGLVRAEVRARHRRRAAASAALALVCGGLAGGGIVYATDGSTQALIAAPSTPEPNLTQTPPASPSDAPSAPAVRVLAPGPGDPALGRVELPARVASALTDLPAADGRADLLAVTRVPGGSLYLVGVTGVSGRVRACVTSFTDSPAGQDGGVSCTGGPTVYGDVADDAIGLGGSWTSDHPEREVLEGFAPAGTARVVITPESGGPVALSVSPAGARWGGRVFFVAVVPEGPASVRAIDAKGNTTASATFRGSRPDAASAGPPPALVPVPATPRHS